MPNPDDVAHVGRDGCFIRWMDRQTVHREKLVHRSINVLVFHPNDGRLLIQQRHRNKLTNPGHWDVSVAGHVDFSDHPEGDPNAARIAFERAAVRELQEEIGIRAELILLGVFGPQPQVQYEYNALFRCESLGPFAIQEDELEALQWVNAEELWSISPRTSQLDWIAREILNWRRMENKG